MTNAPKFYAHFAKYGVNTTYNGERLYGTIYRFDSKAARDAWVDADVWDGNYRREAVSAADVRRVVARIDRRDGFVAWARDDDGFDTLS